MLQHMNIPQSRYLSPSTTAHYLAYCKAHAMTPNTTNVDMSHGDGVDAHWIGASDAETVVLYLHGGRYTQPGHEGNMRYLTRLVTDLDGQKGCWSISVLVFAYTLAPEATHPTPLKQASAACVIAPRH
jgi:acetyl esterase/lipase